jgi:ribonuclease P protein component
MACRRTPPEIAPVGPGQKPETRPRLGVVAGRSVGRAVARNRAKRLLREAARAYQARLRPGWDVVLIARAPLARARLAEARTAVGQVLARAGVIDPG